MNKSDSCLVFEQREKKNPYSCAMTIKLAVETWDYNLLLTSCHLYYTTFKVGILFTNYFNINILFDFFV